jgi:hypothetical protein
MTTDLGLPDEVVEKTMIRCLQWVAKHKEIPISVQGAIPSTEDSTGARDPRLPSGPAAVLHPTQLFEASSQPRITPDNPSGIASPQLNQLFLDQAEASDDEPIVVHLAQKTKIRTDAPTTLVDALRAKNKKGDGKDCGLNVLTVARRVQARQFDETVSSRDICTLGAAVLGDVFGARGQKRLAEAFVYLYTSRSKPPLERVLETTVGVVAQQIRDAGFAALSEFTTQWARAVQYDSPRATAIEDIQALHTKVSVVRQWEVWSQPDRLKADNTLSDFLDREGIVHTKHAPLSNRISKYLGKQLGFSSGQVTKKIYNWTPLAIMADVFGQGVFALIPKSLLTSYNSLRVTDGGTKEAKFRTIVEAIAEELPDLVRICGYCDKYIVQPVLSGGLEDGRALLLDLNVPGITMALDGELQKLRQTSILGLVSTESHMPPLGSVRELDGAGSIEGSEFGSGDNGEETGEADQSDVGESSAGEISGDGSEEDVSKGE